MTYTIESTDTLTCDGCSIALGVDYGDTLDRVDLVETTYVIDGEFYCLGCAEYRVTNVDHYAPLEGTVTYFDLGIGV